MRPFKFFPSASVAQAFVVVAIASGSIAQLGCESGGPGTEPDPTPDAEAIELLAWNVFEETGRIDDGSEVPWVWGFQGGTMIRPKIVLPVNTELADGDAVSVVMEHASIVGEPYGVVADFERTLFSEAAYLDTEGRLVVGPLDDQLAWTEITDTVLSLTVRVTLPEGEVVVTRQITLVDGNDNSVHACDAFGVVAPTGCSSVPLPGEMEVVEVVADPNAVGCNDPVLVRGRFIPSANDEVAIEACHIDSQAYAEDAFTTVRDTLHPTIERDCAEASGVVAGARFTAEFVVAVTGTCNPLPNLWWELPDFDCACQ